MLWPWTICRLLIKTGHWNDPEVKLTILNGVECFGLYIVKRLMSFQRWWWHFCVVGGSLHAWLRCNALNYIGQVTQPFFDCWLWSQVLVCLDKLFMHFGNGCTVYWVYRRISLKCACACMCTHICVCVCARTHACMHLPPPHTHTLWLGLCSHYLPSVAVLVVIQLCWKQWVRRLTKLSKLYLFLLFITGITANMKYTF